MMIENPLNKLFHLVFPAKTSKPAHQDKSRNSSFVPLNLAFNFKAAHRWKDFEKFRLFDFFHLAMLFAMEEPKGKTRLRSLFHEKLEKLLLPNLICVPWIFFFDKRKSEGSFCTRWKIEKAPKKKLYQGNSYSAGHSRRILSRQNILADFVFSLSNELRQTPSCSLKFFKANQRQLGAITTHVCRKFHV